MQQKIKKVVLGTLAGVSAPGGDPLLVRVSGKEQPRYTVREACPGECPRRQHALLHSASPAPATSPEEG